MLNTININLKTDIKTDRPTSLPIKLMSQDVNNNQFILRFTSDGESVTLDSMYTVEILTKFTKSGTSRLTSAVVRQGYATWEFDTNYITQDEAVYNYVYVRKSGSLVVSADANCFVFNVDLSEIDKGSGKVAETYDENYEKYLDEFKAVADFTVIQQGEADREASETTRKTNETTRISNEAERKSAEVIRLANEVDRVNAENTRAEFYEGFDGELGKKANKQQEPWITPTMLNGWVNYDEATYVKCGYYKDTLGIVHLRGFIKSGEINKTIFSLPPGYQPEALSYFPTSSVNTAGTITISSFTGDVICTHGNNIWVTLDGISFKAYR